MALTAFREGALLGLLRTKLQVATMGDGLRKTRQDSSPLVPVGDNRRGVRWASILIKVPA